MSYFNYNNEDRLSIEDVASQLYREEEGPFFNRASRKLRPQPPVLARPEPISSVDLARLLEKRAFASSIPAAKLYDTLNAERKGYLTA